MSASSAFFDPAARAGRAALAEALRDGRAVALPTETVPGLAVLAQTPRAQERLAALKGANPERPFTLHLRDKEELQRMLPSLPPGLAPWLDRRMPGPFTVVVPRDWAALPREIEWRWPTVALRLPEHLAYASLAAELPGPLLMTSINSPGEPPLQGEPLAEWLAAREDVILGLDPERTQVRQSSEVVAFEPLPRVLRGELAAAAVRPGLRVLVICTGNICRSPLGAALLQQELASAWNIPVPELQELGWVVASAGTFAMPDSPASENSVLVAQERGLELSAHRATNLGDALRLPWDAILGMTDRHLAALPRGQPGALFDPRAYEVPDPFGGDLEQYRRAGVQMEKAAQEWISIWSRWPGASAG